MSYIDAVAADIYGATPSNGSYDPTSREAILYRVYAVLALSKGTHTTDRDVHDAWSAWTSGFDPNHPSLVPFDELDQFIKDLDRPYREAIHKAALSMGAPRCTHTHCALPKPHTHTSAGVLFHGGYEE